MLFDFPSMMYLDAMAGCPAGPCRGLGYATVSDGEGGARVLRIDLPGVAKADTRVSIIDNVLTVTVAAPRARGGPSASGEGAGADADWVDASADAPAEEAAPGAAKAAGEAPPRYERVFELPERTEAAKVTASQADGQLTITVPAPAPAPAPAP